MSASPIASASGNAAVPASRAVRASLIAPTCVEPVKPNTNASPKRRIALENEPRRKYLIAPSVERPSRFAKPGEDVAGQDEQLEADEEDEQVLPAREQHRAAQREQQRRAELGHRQPARHEVVGREEDRQQADRQDERVEQGRGHVAHVEAVERDLRRPVAAAPLRAAGPVTSVTASATPSPMTLTPMTRSSRPGRAMSTSRTSRASPATRRNGRIASHSFCVMGPVRSRDPGRPPRGRCRPGRR